MGRKKKEGAAQPSESVESTTPENVQEATDRDALYAQYEASQQTEATPEEVESVEEPEEAEEEVEEVEEAESEEYTEAAPEEAEEDESTDKQKTVPYGAFHEERERRKTLQKQVEELSGQVKILLNDNKALMGKSKTDPETPEIDLQTDFDPDDYDSTTGALKGALEAIKALKSEINSIKNIEQTRTVREQESEAERQQAAVKKRITTIDSSLSEEGYPGFNMFVDRMNQKLDDLINEDPGNIYLDNDDGYKKIYKEYIYPEVKKIFAGQEKQEAFDKKKDLKSKANLGKGSSAPQSKKEDEDDYSFESYMADRKQFNHGSLQF